MSSTSVYTLCGALQSLVLFYLVTKEVDKEGCDENNYIYDYIKHEIILPDVSI